MRADNLTIGTGGTVITHGTAFTPVTVIHAEGARAGISTCRQCGAAILVDPRDKTDWQHYHDEWHKRK